MNIAVAGVLAACFAFVNAVKPVDVRYAEYIARLNNYLSVLEADFDVKPVAPDDFNRQLDSTAHSTATAIRNYILNVHSIRELHGANEAFFDHTDGVLKRILAIFETSVECLGPSIEIIHTAVQSIVNEAGPIRAEAWAVVCGRDKFANAVLYFINKLEEDYKHLRRALLVNHLSGRSTRRGRTSGAGSSRAGRPRTGRSGARGSHAGQNGAGHSGAEGHYR